MSKARVAVLLSTFNGSQYISEQLDSLLSQEDVALDVYVRDDGSLDNTTEIIESYIQRNENIFLIKGNNVGVTHSFFKLLQLNEVKGYDYYAFCDQDDYWLKNKLSSMIAEVNNDKACLVCCSYSVTDENLQIINNVISNEQKKFGCALVDNHFPGCTMLFNNKLFSVIAVSLQNSLAWRFSIHDLWVVLIAIALGEVIVTNKIGILYRQHSKNVIGASTTFRSAIKRSIGNTLRMRYKHSYIDDAIIFFRVFKDFDLPKNVNHALADAIKSGGCFFNRLQAVLNGNIYKCNSLCDLYFKFRILFHLYRVHINLDSDLS